MLFRCLSFKSFLFNTFAAILLLSASAVPAAAMPIWINEIHYDNASDDTGEFFEIAGVAGTELSNYKVILYNGFNGEEYGTVALSGTLGNDQNGFGVLSFPRAPIQNGAPDGLALVFDNTIETTLVQFLSYEGAFAATEGVANGETSTDISVKETASTPAGFSLQLTGVGGAYDGFSWAAPSPETPDLVNTNQRFTVPDGGMTFGLYLPLIGLLIGANRRREA